MQGHLVMLQAILSVPAIVLGLGGVIRGWQMRYRNRLDLISDWNNLGLPNPAAYAQQFARVYIEIGCVLLAMPLLFLTKLPILLWAGILAVVIWYWFYAIEKIAEKARAAKR